MNAGVPCWLVREVFVPVNGVMTGGAYARPVRLPFVPSKGDGLLVLNHMDPEDVAEVYINGLGAAVVVIEPIHDSSEYESAEEAVRHLAYETAGWRKLSGDHCAAEHYLPPPEQCEDTPVHNPVRCDPFGPGDGRHRRHVPPFNPPRR